MKHKKGNFTTFICSLLPGAAEMYMGFMKNGISIMGIFFLSFIIPVVLRVSDVFVLIAGLIWFYAFFHARNLASCSEEQLQNIPDEYIWEDLVWAKKIEISNPTLRKWGAVILIFYGVVLLWQTLSDMLFHIMPEWLLEYLAPVIREVPQIVVALIIIAVGFKLIAGKKEELNSAKESVEIEASGREKEASDSERK